MEIYEKICKVIELYNKYKGNLNDDGTVATDEQIAEWIVPSIEDCKEEINAEELDKLANIASHKVVNDIYKNFGFQTAAQVVDYLNDLFKAGYCKALEINKK